MVDGRRPPATEAAEEAAAEAMEEAAARAAFIELDPDEYGWLAEADLPKALGR